MNVFCQNGCIEFIFMFVCNEEVHQKSRIQKTTAKRAIILYETKMWKSLFLLKEMAKEEMTEQKLMKRSTSWQMPVGFKTGPMAPS